MKYKSYRYRCNHLDPKVPCSADQAGTVSAVNLDCPACRGVDFKRENAKLLADIGRWGSE